MEELYGTIGCIVRALALVNEVANRATLPDAGDAPPQARFPGVKLPFLLYSDSINFER